MRQILKILLFIAMLISAAGSGVALSQQFPESNGISLKGLTSVDAMFTVAAWLNVTTEEAGFQQLGQTSLELALRRDGVVVETSAPNYLFCTVQAAESTSGLVFFTYTVEYYGFNSEGLHPLLWQKGGISTIGLTNFNAEIVAKNCADIFLNEWLKQNPRVGL